jgi:hypothetical protein
VIRKIAQGAQVGLNIGQQLGLFPADTVTPQAAAVQPNQLELQGFWSIVKKIAKTATTVAGVAASVGLLSTSPQATAAQVQPSELELQGFWSVVKKIGQGVQYGYNIGQQLGIFSVQPMSAAGEPPRTVQLAQALPTLQALIAQQQGSSYGASAFAGQVH